MYPTFWSYFGSSRAASQVDNSNAQVPRFGSLPRVISFWRYTNPVNTIDANKKYPQGQVVFPCPFTIHVLTNICQISYGLLSAWVNFVVSRFLF